MTCQSAADLASPCDREVRRLFKLATAGNATADAATTTTSLSGGKAAAAIRTMPRAASGWQWQLATGNAPTDSDPQTLLGFRGIAHPLGGPSVTCEPECAADGMSTAAQEMTRNGGLRWELAVGGRG